MAWVVVYRETRYKQPVQHLAEDVQLQSASNEPRDGWIGKQINPDLPSPRAFQLYYRQQWAEDVQDQSAANEPRDGWPRIRPLQQPYDPRPQLFIWHQDWNGVAAEPPISPSWAPRQLPGQYRPNFGLYRQQNAAWDSAPVVDEIASPWSPRYVVIPYRPRPSLYWAPAGDIDVAPVAVVPRLPTHWMRRLELLSLRVWG